MCEKSKTKKHETYYFRRIRNDNIAFPNPRRTLKNNDYTRLMKI